MSWWVEKRDGNCYVAAFRFKVESSANTNIDTCESPENSLGITPLIVHGMWLSVLSHPYHWNWNLTNYSMLEWFTKKTPSKTNISPEKCWLEDEFIYPSLFCGPGLAASSRRKRMPPTLNKLPKIGSWTWTVERGSCPENWHGSPKNGRPNKE